MSYSAEVEFKNRYNVPSCLAIHMLPAWCEENDINIESVVFHDENAKGATIVFTSEEDYFLYVMKT
jgi:hypothetical protein